MTTRRTLFLEGDRIVDADGATVRELTPEGRQLALRMARMRAIRAQDVPPEEDPILGPILAQARRIVAGMSADERSARRASVEELEAHVRRRAEQLLPERLAEYHRRMAAMEQAIPDDTTERLPLVD
jgi:hypothetical protein